MTTSFGFKVDFLYKNRLESNMYLHSRRKNIYSCLKTQLIIFDQCCHLPKKSLFVQLPLRQVHKVASIF